MKKAGKNLKNPIEVRALFNEPEKNYSEIQRLFKERIDQVNGIYSRELFKLGNIMEKMSLEKAIKDGYIYPNDIYREQKIDPEGWIKVESLTNKYDVPDSRELEIKKITFKDILYEYPEAGIWYLNDVFSTDLAFNDYMGKEKLPYFGKKKFLYNIGKEYQPNFISYYEQYFMHLPISKTDEKLLFNHFVIGAVREKDEEKRDNKLWELAYDLTDNTLYEFVEKLEILDHIKSFQVEMEYETLNRFGF